MDFADEIVLMTKDVLGLRILTNWLSAMAIKHGLRINNEKILKNYYQLPEIKTDMRRNPRSTI